jgi:DNA-binding transcriptional LysR family regulator
LQLIKFIQYYNDKREIKLPIEAYLKNLRSVQLRLLVTIADTGKLSVAANLCNMTTPGASRILSELEKNLDIVLFDRSSLGMTPTKLGEGVIEDARLIIRDIDTFSKNVSDLKMGYTGKLKVGAVTGAALNFVLPAITQIKTERPLLDISIDVAASDRLMRGVLRGEYDLAFARLANNHFSEGLKFEKVLGERLNFVVGRKNEFFNRPVVNLIELKDQMWTIQGVGSPLRVTIEKLFQEKKLEIPKNLIQTDSVMAILHLLINTNVVAILTEEVTNLLKDSGAFKNLKVLNTGVDPIVEPYYLVSQRSSMENPLTEPFLKILKSIQKFRFYS